MTTNKEHGLNLAAASKTCCALIVLDMPNIVFSWEIKADAHAEWHLDSLIENTRHSNMNMREAFIKQYSTQSLNQTFSATGHCFGHGEMEAYLIQTWSIHPKKFGTTSRTR